MSGLILPSRHTVQPQSLAPVVPLFGRPPACFVWNKPFGFRNIVGGAGAGTVAGTAASLGGIYGPVLGIKGTGSKVITWFLPSVFCRTSDGAGTGDFTFAAMADPANAATKMGLLSQDGTTIGQAYLIANCNAAYSTTAGAVMFGSADPTESNVSAAGQTDGNMHFWVGTRVAGVMSLYRDGVLVASSSLTVRNILASPSGIGCAIGGLYGYSGYESTANHVFSAMFNYGMTAAEVAAWSKNPWQIFKAPTRRLWIGASTGGGSTYNVDAADSITSTDGATQQLTAPATATDTASAADTASNALTIAASTTDAASATDSTTSASAVNSAATDAISATDAATQLAVMPAAASDSVSAADTANNVATMAAAATDAATATESATGLRITTAAATDAATATDTASQVNAVNVAASDAISAADAATVQAVLAGIVSDGFSAADAATLLAGIYNVTAADVLSLLDLAAADGGVQYTRAPAGWAQPLIEPTGHRAPVISGSRPGNINTSRPANRGGRRT